MLNTRCCIKGAQSGGRVYLGAASSVKELQIECDQAMHCACVKVVTKYRGSSGRRGQAPLFRHRPAMGPRSGEGAAWRIRWRRRSM